jgi:hypothetical protein
MEDITTKCTSAAADIVLALPPTAQITSALMLLTVQQAVLAGARIGLAAAGEPVRRHRRRATPAPKVTA